MVYCSKTKEEMFDGWYNDNTGEYFKYEKDYLNHIDKIIEETLIWHNVDLKDKDTMKKVFLKEEQVELPISVDDRLEYAYNHLGCYWPEWLEDEEE